MLGRPDPVLGKLFALADNFRTQNPDCDGSEIPSCIHLLDKYGWDVLSVDVLIKFEACSVMSPVEIGHYRDILETINENNLNPNASNSLSENEKLDRVVELCKSDSVSADYETVRTIAEKLKLEDPSI